MNSKRIFRIKTFAVCFVSVVGLAACGGGGSSVVKTPSVNVNPPSGSDVKYGAIYSYRSNNLQEFRYYYDGNTQAWINNHALSNCRADSSRSSCRIEDTFTNCVALARGNRIRAYATSNDLASARSSALARCRQLGGTRTGCSNFLGICNTPVTRQTSKVGGSSNLTLSPTATPPPSSNVKHSSIYSYTARDGSRKFSVDYEGNRGSETEARGAITALCRLSPADYSNCNTEAVFTNCGAVAYGMNNFVQVFGYATDDTLSRARSSAIAQCTQRGGTGCSTTTPIGRVEVCNNPITPQTSKVGGSTPAAMVNPSPSIRFGAVYSYRSNNIQRFGYVFSTSTIERTEAQARSAALNVCSTDYSNCSVEFTFTNCIAHAESGGTTFGIATGNNLASARSSALAECRRFGGDSCAISSNSAQCNVPNTPQASFNASGISNSQPPAPVEGHVRKYSSLFSYTLLGKSSVGVDVMGNHDSEEEARTAGLRYCNRLGINQNCRIYRIFTNCAAVAISETGWGAGISNSLSGARSLAVDFCREGGGTGCSTDSTREMCNDPYN